jgi:spermidine synthase
MSTGTNGQLIQYKNSAVQGLYLLEDDHAQAPPQLTAIRIEKLLEACHSPYQHIAIYASTFHGNVLVLDGVIQTTVADNFCYHEMIVHVPVAVLPHAPKEVLVIGGGDGGVVNELSKYPCIEKIVWVDIDPTVVALCQKHMPELHTYHDQRIEYMAMDGADIEYQDRFDLIVVDGTDPVDGKASLWSQKFYAGLTSALKAEGMITALGFWAWPESELYTRTKTLAQAHFRHVYYYWFADPSMRYGYTGVLLITNSSVDPRVPHHSQRLAAPTQFYNAAIHRAAFAIPNCFAS